MITDSLDEEGRAWWQPDAELDSEKYYSVNWTTWLTNENDTIDSVVWEVPAGLVKMDEKLVGNIAAVKLQATTIGTHLVRCVMNSRENTETQKPIQTVHLKVFW